jgi:5-methylcytosine-specific restriction endonuclease McrA
MFDKSDLVKILESQEFRCVYCKANLRKVKRHIDHIVPLSRGGSCDRGNIQYLCAPCNLSKGHMDPIEFARRRGLLFVTKM